MKNSSTIILSLLAATGAAFGQTASNLVAPVAPSGSGSGTHQFVLNGRTEIFTLCNFEMCQRAPDGQLRVSKVAGGSTAAVVGQASIPDQENFLVFYPVGKEGIEEERRILRHRYLVKLKPGADLSEIQARCGMKKITLLFPGEDLAVCEEESAGRVLSQLNVVAGDPGIEKVEPLLARKKAARAVPTDPFFSAGNRGDGQYQWYLRNTGENGGVVGVDINVEPPLPNPPPVPPVQTAWDRATGTGVDIAIVDDGVAIDHPDLAPNVPTGQPHLNLVNNNDPTNPRTLDESLNHGTAVAGLAAAKGNNALGMAGAAYNARISGVRLLGGFFDDVDEALALNFRTDVIDVSNNSWGPIDSTLVFSGPGLAASAAVRLAAIGDPDVTPIVPAGRGGLGVIYVWAGGNGGDIRDNSNYDGYANSIYTISVGAIADSGRKAPYSERGSNLVVSAPSSGGAQDMLSTRFTVILNEDDELERTYDPELGAINYTTEFGGTSAATPLVSGVVALMLEVNPNLGWRDVQDILIRTARKNDPINGDWIENGAGLHFNHDFGAGLVDARAAVAASAARLPTAILAPAVRQKKLILFRRNSTDPAIPNGLVPDGGGGSYLATFDFRDQDNLNLEHVEVNLTAITLNRSDLEIILISPNGTQSILQESDLDHKEQGIDNWTFTTVRNWGEDSAGTWLLRVTDRITGNPAIINDATLTLHGVPDPTGSLELSPILISSKLITVNQGQQFSYRIESVAADEVAVGDLPAGVTYNPATLTITGAPANAGAFQIPILLKRDGIEITATVTLIVRPVAVALGSALGLPEYPAVTGGDVPWDFDFNDTNDGGVPPDQRVAARSGEGLENNQQSIFGFNGLPKKVMLFDWRSSSEEGADRLWFNLGGDVPQSWKAFISGERGWGTTAVPLPAASNNVRWIYTKDGPNNVTGLDSAGQDRGLVDNVRLIDTDKYLSDVYDAANIVGFTPELDSRMWWIPVEFPGRSPLKPGDKSMALRSPTIGNGQTVSMSAWVDGPGEFKFLAVNFAAPEDVFEFLVDGALVATRAGSGATGDRSPLTVNRALGEGRHRIQLRFRKDFRGSESAEVFKAQFDGVLLDDVQFIPTTSFNNFATNFGPDALLPYGDEDGDGHTNYAEYAFGGNVMVSDIPALLPKVVTGENGSAIEYGVDTTRTDLKYVPQQSTDLTEWVDAKLVKLDRVEGEIEYYRIPYFSTNGRERLYFRVIAQPK